MARYIDADELSRRMYHDAFETDSDMQRWDSGCWIRYKMFENAINDAPTADVRENVKGEWFADSDGKIRCSNCLKIPINEIRIRGNLVYDMKPIEKLMKFCPNCGARMVSE